ncbi:MAG: 3'(2'),5'-bisphosphate nucleotidase CysQ [archaeon]
MDIDIGKIIGIAKKAGEAILEVYKSDFDVEYKKDETFKEGTSPLTQADKNSNEIIANELQELYPEIPFLSEESKKISYEERKNWEIFWLVDPLDGTKEFIKKSGEFTVNIALIKNRKPILGVVYVPVKDICYYADNNGAFKQVQDERPIKIPINYGKRNKLIVVASKNHMNKETENFISGLEKENEVGLANVGSSLKFCLVAEGKADIYPRLGLTSEWDTAAAHAIVNAAGKKVYQYGKDEELIYNKENLLNPWFVVK